MLAVRSLRSPDVKTAVRFRRQLLLALGVIAALNPKRVVFTGGPGAGKTAVLDRLQELGYTVVPEVARQIIAERKSKGFSPRPSPVEFARAILEQDIQQYDCVSDELVFFDRSILDALGMLRECDDLSDEEREELLVGFPYYSPVFVFPPWADIYRTDSERDQSFEESKHVHASINDWYLQCGYDVWMVPLGTVDERCEHILHVLGEQK